MTEIQTYYLQLYTHTQKLAKKKNTENIENHIFIERKRMMQNEKSTWNESGGRRRRRNRKVHQKEGQEKYNAEVVISIPLHIFLGFLWAWERKEKERLFINWIELTPPST